MSVDPTPIEFARIVMERYDNGQIEDCDMGMFAAALHDLIAECERRIDPERPRLNLAAVAAAGDNNEMVGHMPLPATAEQAANALRIIVTGADQ